jgi:hypothetical protein
MEVKRTDNRFTLKRTKGSNTAAGTDLVTVNRRHVRRTELVAKIRHTRGTHAKFCETSACKVEKIVSGILGCECQG